MTTAMAINIVLAAIAFVAIVGLAVWGIATQHHDHHHLFGRLQLAHRAPAEQPEMDVIEREAA